MQKVTLKNGKEFHYKNEIAQFKSQYVLLTPKSKTKRVMLGGYKLECFYIYKGEQSEVFNTIKNAKQSFANMVDNSQPNEKKEENEFHLLMLDICREIEIKENAKKKSKVFFSKELDDVLGLNVFKK